MLCSLFLLQEASIPLGAIVGILDYIEKRRKSKKTSSSQQRLSTSGGYHQVVSHPPIYSPSEPISRSSAPTPAPSAMAYLTQQFQQPESPFPVVNSQVPAESATPTPAHYSPASHYPQQSGQMKPLQFEQLLSPGAPQYPSSPHDQNLQQQQQFQYTQPHQLQQSQQINGGAPSHQQVASPSSLLPHQQPQYQQQQQQQPPLLTSSSSSSSSSAQSHAQIQPRVQQQLPQNPQQQVQASEVHPARLPLVSLPPHSSSGSGGGGGGGSQGSAVGGSVATSPTTAQRRITLPTPAAASQRGESTKKNCKRVAVYANVL